MKSPDAPTVYPAFTGLAERLAETFVSVYNTIQPIGLGPEETTAVTFDLLTMAIEQQEEQE